jgi:hypothetical protein
MFFRGIGGFVKYCTVLRVLVPDQRCTVLIVLYYQPLKGFSRSVFYRVFSKLLLKFVRLNLVVNSIDTAPSS